MAPETAGDTPPVKVAVAAGHPATADAGLEILAAGGSAADAAVAASLASCVAETLMTGLLGGGHAIYWEAAAGRARNLDFFVAVPGLEGEGRERSVEQIGVPFGEELIHYAIGPATCGVPGLPAGLEALWRAHGHLPWPRLFEPALRLALDGALLTRAHAACLVMLAPVFTLSDGARIYAPRGDLLQAGELVEQPGLARALELLVDEGGAAAYGGAIGRSLLELSDELGGAITAGDLRAYEAVWREPLACDYLQGVVLTRGGLSEVPPTLARLPQLAGLPPGAQLVALTEALAAIPDADGHTTNVVTVDASGDVCVLTTTLGLGSGDWLPGLDLQLNSMLGESDLVRGPLVPGERMESMTAPLLAFDGDGRLAFAGGAAGGTRIRTALVTVLAGVLDEGLPLAEAVARPRCHPAGRTLNTEPGTDERGLADLEERGWTVRRWAARHHYFGGVSAVTPDGAAGDPRRDGAARILR
jgi:gamma-glutamyltranspeptidase / glutathione hydrolase